MIKIIGTDYAIESDSREYIVGKIKKYKNKKGEIVEAITSPAYVPTIQVAIKTILKNYQFEACSSAVDLKDLLSKFDALEQKFESILKSAVKE